MWTLTELELLRKIKELAETINLEEILKLVNIRIAEIELEMQKEAEVYKQTRNLEEVTPYKIKDKFDIRRNENGRQII
jgi:hypothetical protein